MINCGDVFKHKYLGLFKVSYISDVDDCMSSMRFIRLVHMVDKHVIWDGFYSDFTKHFSRYGGVVKNTATA